MARHHSSLAKPPTSVDLELHRSPPSRNLTAFTMFERLPPCAALRHSFGPYTSRRPAGQVRFPVHAPFNLSSSRGRIGGRLNEHSSATKFGTMILHILHQRGRGMAPSVSNRGRATRTRLSHTRALSPLSRRRFAESTRSTHGRVDGGVAVDQHCPFPLNVLLRFVTRLSLRHTAATKQRAALVMARLAGIFFTCITHLEPLSRRTRKCARGSTRRSQRMKRIQHTQSSSEPSAGGSLSFSAQ